MPDPQPFVHTGRRIGAYDILEVIGHGGMGKVYRAARADGKFDRRVAIKLVRLDVFCALDRCTVESNAIFFLNLADRSNCSFNFSDRG